MQTKTRKLSSFVIALILLTSLGAAITLLTHYGNVNSIADVDQSVVLEGSECVNNDCMHDFGTIIAGNTYEYCDVTVKNNADVTIPVKFETVVTDSMSNPVTFATVRYLSTVSLTNKDSNWDSIGTMNADVKFELVGSNFEFDIEASGLDASTQYSLIYYADKPDRFVNWGGNNPGRQVGIFTTDVNGDYSAAGISTSLGMNMPNVNDDNYNPNPDYCVSDEYDLCYGAKLWIVPSVEYDNLNNKLIAWNPDNYLFETDLITYSDKQDLGHKLFIGKGQVEMCVEVTFDPATPADSYSINVTVATV